MDLSSDEVGIERGTSDVADKTKVVVVSKMRREKLTIEVYWGWRSGEVLAVGESKRGGVWSIGENTRV
jgi:hypothetical protein